MQSNRLCCRGHLHPAFDGSENCAIPLKNRFASLAARVPRLLGVDGDALERKDHTPSPTVGTSATGARFERPACDRGHSRLRQASYLADLIKARAGPYGENDCLGARVECRSRPFPGGCDPLRESRELLDLG